MTPLEKKQKKVKAVKALVVQGKVYRSPKAAAEQWAAWVRIRMGQRRTRALGYASYHDREWFERPQVMNAREIAYRRSLPIFTKFFKG
jgi:hypothetical protein